jgi:hypothetical protein
MTQPRHLDERLLDALDTWAQDAEEQVAKACQLVDDLAEIRERHERGEITDADIRKLEASIGAEGTSNREEQRND